MPSVDDLRQQLRDRGYLSHGIERWFALDPWSSRAFWLELVTVAGKAGALIAAFAVLPMVAIMLFRNHPLLALETLALAAGYAAAWVVAAAGFVVLIALVLKLRPALAIDTPRALLAISLGAAAVLTGLIAIWWSRFDIGPSSGEIAIGLALLTVFFLMATLVVSAALLSFSIYELRRVPAIHQKPRTVPMSVAAAVLLALLFIPAYGGQERGNGVAPMIVTTPTTRRIALIAVDGLSSDLFLSRQQLVATFATVQQAATVPGESTTERWASVGTGVPTFIHGVHAIDGVRIAGGRHVLQSVSRADFVLRELAPALRLAHRLPLPPTVRRRDYIWEVFAGRGMPSLAVNWWTTDDRREGALASIGQESIFAASNGSPTAVDEQAMRKLLAELDRQHPQFAAAYLPALDIVLNRIELDPASRVAASVRALDGLTEAVSALRNRGYDVVVIGLPGDGQGGLAVLASTIPFQATRVTAFDAAPTLCELLGFPLSAEMPGRSLVATSDPPRVTTYGARAASSQATKVDDEYYETLRSLGYIR